MTAEIKTQEDNLGKTITTGVIGIFLVLLIGAMFIFPFEHHFFTDWVGTAFMAATPMQIVIGLMWHNNKPDFVNKYSAPVKGLLLTLITIVAGVIVLGALLLLVSGGHGITPMLVQYTIMTIVVTLWLLPIWQCWPVSLFTKDPVKMGLLTLIFAYLIAYVLWQLFFDYSLLGKIGHPHYYKDIDPKGMFNMWSATTFFVTTAGVIVVHTLFDFWPVEKITKGMAQPLRGIIATLYILLISWLIRMVFVDFIQLEQVDYMVRVPVCMIFGTFLVNNMMQFSLFTNLKQPIRGLVLLMLATITALIMYQLYAIASSLHTGTVLGTGPQGGFQQEIWIASAMLGITFPVIFLVSGFFNFWPIKSK